MKVRKSVKIQLADSNNTVREPIQI